MIARKNSGARILRKGVSAEDTRRRRDERSIAIRKNKRMENLQKRRHMAQSGQGAVTGPVSSVPGGDGAVEAEVPKLELLSQYLAGECLTVPAPAPRPPTPAAAAAACTVSPYRSAPPCRRSPVRAADVDSQEATAQLRGTSAIRRLLSIDREPPVDAVIQSGAIPKLVSLLSRNDSQGLQFEAAWALTNVASGTTHQTRAVVESGATEVMVQLLRSPDANVREQCVWCLGNIAGEGADCRDLILRQPDAVNNVLLNIAHPASNSVLQNATWTLSNLFRGKPQPELAVLQPAMAAFPHLLQNADPQVVADACWALSYLTDGDESCIDAVIHAGVLPLLMPLMERGSAKCVVPALRAVGNVVSGSDRQTQAVLDNGALPRLLSLLNADKRSVRKEACWTLSNVAAGTPAQAGALAAVPNGIEALADVARTDVTEIRREAGWTLFNLCTGGVPEHAHAVAQRGGIRALARFLSANDVSVLNAALDAFREILRYGEEADKLHAYVQEAEDAEMLDKLEGLQDHEDEAVYEKVQRMLEEFFDVEDETGDGENEAENAEQPAPSQFAFGDFGGAPAAPAFSFGGAPSGGGAPAGGFSFA